MFPYKQLTVSVGGGGCADCCDSEEDKLHLDVGVAFGGEGLVDGVFPGVRLMPEIRTLLLL